MKKILGITGGIGAGKSMVSKLFAELGATVVDADKIAREVLEPNGRAYDDVVNIFGKDILNYDKTINRKKLANVVFSDSKKLEHLNQLTHPAVCDEIQEQVDNATTTLVCLDVPLLFTCDFPIFCHKTLAVIASNDVRLARVMKRDGCTKEEAEARMKKQLSNQEFEEKADLCIWNNGNEDALKKEVFDKYNQIMEK